MVFETDRLVGYDEYAAHLISALINPRRLAGGYLIGEFDR